MMNICENCTFWKRYADRSWGVCHRYPEFVEQNEEEWCGEYVARQPGPTETASLWWCGRCKAHNTLRTIACTVCGALR